MLQMCLSLKGLITIFKNIMKKEALKGKTSETMKKNGNAAT